MKNKGRTSWLIHFSCLVRPLFFIEKEKVQQKISAIPFKNIP